MLVLSVVKNSGFWYNIGIRIKVYLMNDNKDLNTAIPSSIKDDFDKFEDVPREESDKHKYASPAEVVKKTSEKSSEITDSAEKEEEKKIKTIENELDEALELDSGFKAFLDQLNITKQQFFMFSGFVLFLIFAVIMSFIFLFRFFGTSEEQVRVIGIQEPVQQVMPTTLDEDEEEKFGIFSRFSNLFGDKEEDTDQVIEDEIVFDEEEVEEITQEEVSEEDIVIPAGEVGRTPEILFDTFAIRATTSLGSAELRENRLSFYIRTYRQVRNIFNTDLYSYLARVPDRAEGFNAFLLQFKGANEQAKLAYEELRQEIEDLDARVTRLRQEASQIEDRFFDALDNLESEFIQERLRAFQEVSARRDLAISELRARQAIAAIYTRALPLIETKITAIELNRDPFVAGVRVVDFRQVDLDLIIRER